MNMNQDDDIALEAKRSMLQKLLGFLQKEMLAGHGDEPLAAGAAEDAMAEDAADDGAMGEELDPAAAEGDAGGEVDPLQLEIRSFMKKSARSAEPEGKGSKMINGMKGGLPTPEPEAEMAPPAAKREPASFMPPAGKSKRGGRRGRGIV